MLAWLAKPTGNSESNELEGAKQSREVFLFYKSWQLPALPYLLNTSQACGKAFGNEMMTSADAGVIFLPKGPSCSQLSWEQSVLGATSRKEESCLQGRWPRAGWADSHLSARFPLLVVGKVSNLLGLLPHSLLTNPNFLWPQPSLSAPLLQPHQALSQAQPPRQSHLNISGGLYAPSAMAGSFSGRYGGGRTSLLELSAVPPRTTQIIHGDNQPHLTSFSLSILGPYIKKLPQKPYNKRDPVDICATKCLVQMYVSAGCQCGACTTFSKASRDLWL